MSLLSYEDPRDTLQNDSRLSNGTPSKEDRCASRIVDKSTSPTPRRSPKFGNLLEVPKSEREGLQSHSTSVSTDEGIAMDDTSPNPPASECYTTTEPREVI